MRCSQGCCAVAIDLHQWKQILAANVKGRALSAGYPDMLIAPKDWGVGPAIITIRPDSAKVAAHHGWRGDICDSHDLFMRHGLELEVIDRAVYQGCERVVDLNEWSKLGDGGDGYDLVIDPGTSEHCFNIPQALVNLADAVKVGGCISQALPMAMFNHGYWNVNPVALIDFYEANGFRIERMLLRHERGNFEPGVDTLRRRLSGVPDGAVNLLLARRLERKAFRWPQQKLP